MTKSLLGTKYPKDELRYGWEMILTNQFHDIIPGSSIREVYEQCDLDYAEIFSIGQDAYRHARKTLSKVRRKIGFTELKFSEGAIAGIELKLVGQGLAPAAHR